MRMFVLGLVLVAMCVVPAQSQMVIDAELVDVAGITRATYEIGVKNVGETERAEVILDDTLPANVSYVESSFVYPEGEILPEPTIAQNSDGTTKNLSWSLGDFEPEEKKRIELVLSHGSNVEVDYEENVAKIRCEEPKEAIAEVPTIEAGRISITKKVVDEKGRPISGRSLNVTNGDHVWYRIQIYHGRYDLESVTITDRLPNGLNYTSGDNSSAEYVNEETAKSRIEVIEPETVGNTPTWDIGRVEAAEFVVFYLSATVEDDSVSDLIYENRAYAEGTIEYETPPVRVRIGSSEAVLPWWQT